MHPYMDFLKNGALPTDKKEEHMLEIKQNNYVILEYELYKKMQGDCV